MELIRNKLRCCKSSKKTEAGKENNEYSRDKWGSHLDFWLSVLGWNIGLSNLWRFPYLCVRNGGGAFLVPYFTFLFLCALPLMFLEFSVAQYASQGVIGIWKMCPLFKGVGYSTSLLVGLCGIYYIVIITWIIYYLVSSFAAEVPWASCGNRWNTPYCVSTSQSDENMYVNGTALAGNNSQVTTQPSSVSEYYSNSTYMLEINGTASFIGQMRTSVEEFWRFNVLEISNGIDSMGSIRWQLLLCFGVAWVITFFCVIKGIKSSGKVVYVTATLPYILLVVLLVRGALLNGSLEGIKYYVTPNFQKLKDVKVWAEACVQIFYSMGMCWGAILTMASYNHFNYNCYRDSLILTTCGALTSFFAGFVIFSVIGFLAVELNMPVSEVVKGGPGLAFIVYPEALSKLPGAPFWSVLFFIMLFSVGIDGQFPMVESIATSITDEFPSLERKKTLVSALLCLVGFITGLPMIMQGGVYVLQTMDWFLSVFAPMVIGICECLVLSWIYGGNRMYDNLEEMLGFRPNRWWQMCWRVITPLTVFAIIIFNAITLKPVKYGEYEYPKWANVFGYILAIGPILPIPGCMILLIIREDGPILQRIRKLLQPSDDFGPSKKPKCYPEDRVPEECQLHMLAIGEEADSKGNGDSLTTKCCLSASDVNHLA